MIPPVAHARIDAIEDGANFTPCGVVVVRSPPASTTVADTVDVLSWRRYVLLNHPTRTVDRFIIPDRTVPAPRLPLPQRVLSP